MARIRGRRVRGGEAPSGIGGGGKMLCRRNPGFTLIELLVVIAIIAILAAIIFPVMMIAKDKGREAHCQGNIRQLCEGLQTYCTDYGSWGGIVTGTIDYWWPYVEKRSGAKPGESGYVAGPGNRTGIFKYIRSADVLICPSDPGKHFVDRMADTGRVTGLYTYAWSYTINGGCPDMPDRLRRPSKMPAWVEENIDYNYKNGDSNYGNTINDLTFVGSDITSCKHHGRSNIGFADGHVQSFIGPLTQDKAVWPGTKTFLFYEQ